VPIENGRFGAIPIGVIPWSPQARGKLSRDWDYTSIRTETDGALGRLFAKTDEADRKVADRVAEVAKARGLARAQIALAWLLAKPAITAPIWIGGASDAALRRAARFAAVWQPTPLPVAQLVERRDALRRACEIAGREPIPTRMSFRVEFSTITGTAPPAGKDRPPGAGTPTEVASDLLRYCETAGVDAFQINFHGNRDLDHLLQSMDCFMREVAPAVSAKA
jgi:alkanesulfonate monooxygenase SsuD/methylene tetrahydromethanopterin reductase-like flavin-dependent oxidoreductase (luciferase family)